MQRVSQDCMRRRSGRAEAGSGGAAPAVSGACCGWGFVMALAMTLHNMPEGFAVRPSAMQIPLSKPEN